MRHWTVTICWIIHRIYSHLSRSLPISYIHSACHYSPCQVWKEAAVPGCDVLIPLVLIDVFLGKNPPRTGTLLLGKKPWTTPAHDTLMLCKLWKYFNIVRIENRSKDGTARSVTDCIISFSQTNEQNVEHDLFFRNFFLNFRTLVYSGRY